MRKLIFGLVAVLVTISLANAWSIEKKEYTDSGIKYHIYCNGMTMVTSTKDGRSYWDNKGIHHNTLNSAIEASCKKSSNSSNIVTIKKGATLFKKRFGKKNIEYCLKSELKWSICEVGTSMGDHPTVQESSKVKILKRYSGANLIDDYYKITDKHDIYYVRKQDIQ